MFENIMSVERHSLLEQLIQLGLLQDFYLAGGTGAALYLGHRWSEDLDFFTGQEFDSFQLAGKLAEIDGFLLTGQEQGTLHCLFNGVKVSFLFYPYSLQMPKMFRDVSWKEIKKHFILRQKERTEKILEGP